MHDVTEFKPISRLRIENERRLAWDISAFEEAWDAEQRGKMIRKMQGQPPQWVALVIGILGACLAAALVLLAWSVLP